MTKTKSPFDYYQLLEEVYQSLGLEKASEEQKTQIMSLIEERVEERLIETVMSAFGKEDYEIMEAIMEKKPEIDPLDVIIETAAHKEGLPQKIEKEIEQLKKEFTHLNEVYEKA